jgi:hypothetical protein
MDSVKTEVISLHDSGTNFTNTVYKVIYPDGNPNNPPGIYWLYIGYYGSVDLRLDGAYLGLNADPWLMLVPKENQGIITWTCSYHISMDTSLTKYLPSMCDQVISVGIGFSSSNGLSY